MGDIMVGFQNIERRISANADQTRFRVQFKKKGKGNAKVVKTIAEARKLRDATDLPSVKKSSKTDYIKQKPAKKKMEISEISMDALKQLTSASDSTPKDVVKLDLLEKFLESFNRILAL